MATRSTPPEEPKKRPPKKTPPRKRAAAKKKPEPAEPPPRPDLWERQPEETDPAWEAFTLYRDMGLFRSLSKAAKEVGKDPSLLKGWSRTHSWVARCRAWDSELDKEDRAVVVQARRQMRDRHLELAKDVQDKVVAALELFDPETIAKALGPNELIRWLDVSTKVERAALDVGDGYAVDGRGGGRGAGRGPGGDSALTADDFEHLTDEEIRTQLLLLQKEIQSELDDLDHMEEATAS